jgi:acetolactate synthase I/II/III large subunit
VLSGDGGLMVNAGEMATAAQEKVDVTLVVMNDRGYGVIRNIQDKKFGGRHYFADLHTPEMRRFAETFGWSYIGARSEGEIAEAVKTAVAQRGPVLLEIDMNAIGPYTIPFAGPPARVKPA